MKPRIYSVKVSYGWLWNISADNTPPCHYLEWETARRRVASMYETGQLPRREGAD